MTETAPLTIYVVENGAGEAICSRCDFAEASRRFERELGHVAHRGGHIELVRYEGEQRTRVYGFTRYVRRRPCAA